MESIPKKGYFAKELALRTLFGDQAFSDLKKLMDPCCGIGVDKICIAPCGGGPTMCEEIVITAVRINCQTQVCEMDITALNTGGGSISGRIQIQIPIPVLPGVSFVIDADSFSIVGDGSHTVSLPIICSLFASGTFLDGDFPLESANFFAYSLGGVASNLFNNAQTEIICPKIVDCPEDEEIFFGKGCPTVICLDGNQTIEFVWELTENGGTFTPPFFFQTTTDITTPFTWTTLTSVALVVGVNYISIDISSLTPGQSYGYRIIDSSVPPISSFVESTFVEAENEPPTFTVPPACDPVFVIENAAILPAPCDGTTQQLSVQFDYANTGTFVVEVDFSGSGIYQVVSALTTIPGPATFGPTVVPIIGTITLGGPFPARIRDINSGSINSPDDQTVSFGPC